MPNHPFFNLDLMSQINPKMRAIGLALVLLVLVLGALVLSGTSSAANPPISIPLQSGWTQSSAQGANQAFLNIWAMPGVNTDYGMTRTADLYVFAMSPTDMPIPGVAVTIETCDSQESPFTMTGKTRHLAKDKESLTVYDGGRRLVWEMSSAGSTKTGPSLLHLQFTIPQKGGSPLLCAKVFGQTIEGNSPTNATQVLWG